MLDVPTLLIYLISPVLTWSAATCFISCLSPALILHKAFHIFPMGDKVIFLPALSLACQSTILYISTVAFTLHIYILVFIILHINNKFLIYL